jgi:hypothetical protein
LYDFALRALVPNAIYDAGAASPAERSATLNKLAITIAAAALLPRWLFGYDTSDALEIVAPMAAGLVLFDAAYLVALLYKLSGIGNDDDD